MLLLPLTSRAVQVGVLLREAFDALVFVGAWVGMALTVVVPVEANVKFLTFWFGLRFFRMALASSAGQPLVSCLIELQVAQPWTFLARPVKHWLKSMVSITDQSLL